MKHRAEQKSCTGDSTVRIKWFMSRLPGKAREDVNSILRQKSLGNWIGFYQHHLWFASRQVKNQLLFLGTKTVKAAYHIKSTPPNHPIIELIVITVAKTTYPTKQCLYRKYFLKSMYLYLNCNGYNQSVTGLCVIQFDLQSYSWVSEIRLHSVLLNYKFNLLSTL